MRAHEHRCFVRRTGLPARNVVAHNICDGPLSLADVRRHDALMIGGSGDFNVSQRNLPGFERYLDLLREVVACGHPTFASCFGYQSLVHALGGRIVRDVDNTEIGTYTLTLTAEGRADSLFGALPARFAGQMGHKERAESTPPGLPNLASTSGVRYQSLRIPGKPIWATQFHPELDRETNLDRFLCYARIYAREMSPDRKQKIIDGFRDSPETSTLLGKFLDAVFG